MFVDQTGLPEPFAAAEEVLDHPQTSIEVGVVALLFQAAAVDT